MKVHAQGGQTFLEKEGLAHAGPLGGEPWMFRSERRWYPKPSVDDRLGPCSECSTSALFEGQASAMELINFSGLMNELAKPWPPVPPARRIG
jgi:hypothetical protein